MDYEVNLPLDLFNKVTHLRTSYKLITQPFNAMIEPTGICLYRSLGSLFVKGAHSDTPEEHRYQLKVFTHRSWLDVRRHRWLEVTMYIRGPSIDRATRPLRSDFQFAYSLATGITNWKSIYKGEDDHHIDDRLVAYFRDIIRCWLLFNADTACIDVALAQIREKEAQSV